MTLSEFSFVAIGHVESPVLSPKDQDWGSVESRIVLESEFRAGLRGLDDFSHALVLTYLHGARYEAARHLRRRPQGRDTMPEVGIFAQRAKDRPNPIGVTCVRLLSVAEDSVQAPQGAVVPEWVDRLMTGYF